MVWYGAVRSCSRCAVIQCKEEEEEEEDDDDDDDDSGGTVLSSSATKNIRMVLEGCWGERDIPPSALNSMLCRICRIPVRNACVRKR